MSETQRIGAAAGTSNPQPAPPSAHEIVDGYRTNGSLDAERLAEAIFREAGGDPGRVADLKSALAPALGPLERGEVDRALGRQDGISVGEHVLDGVVQFGKGVWGSVKGLGQLAWSGVKTSYDTNLAGLAVDAYERRTGNDAPDWLPSAARGADRLEAGKDAVVALGKAVWNDPSVLLDEYKPLAADGRYGAIVGQVAADFGDLLVGAKGAGKAGKAAGILGRADGVADAAKVAKAADSASELARTVRAVPGGADDAADALKATRAALDEIDTSALPDDVARKVERARGDLVEAQAAALWATDPVTAASLKTGVSREALVRVIDTPRGQRPPVDTYLQAEQIERHLASFDEGAIRFTARDKVEKYGTLANGEGFVMPAKEFDALMGRSGGDLRAVERELGLDPGYLGDSNTFVAFVERGDLDGLRIPTGNEWGANQNWLPGGYTSGGVPEAVADLPKGTPFTEVDLGN